MIERPSPNFDDRTMPVSMIVLHYTGMPDAEGALNRLTSPEAKVSSHYLIDENGIIFRLVDEEKRAWHAGKSRWRGISDVNSASVGIELVNPGHEFGYRNFPDEQIASLIPLVAGIKERHGIGRGNVVGHSDVAPARKEDPGELFPWEALARYRLALPSPTRDLIDPFWTLRAAAALDYRDIHIPPQYLNGMSQLARNLKREAEAAAAMRVWMAAACARW